MSTNRHPARKKRLGRAQRQNRPVPMWVIPRSGRKVRSHPKRHQWRRGRLKI